MNEVFRGHTFRSLIHIDVTYKSHNHVREIMFTTVEPLLRLVLQWILSVLYLQAAAAPSPGGDRGRSYIR